MKQIMQSDKDYRDWIKNICGRFQQSQIKAAVKVNEEMLRFYWVLGKDIEDMKSSAAWGSHFFQKLSNDLTDVLPEVKSFSPRNLQYMNQFYRLYSNSDVTNQVGSQLGNDRIANRVDSQDDLDIIFSIPWGHHKVIMNKCKDDQKKALFFVKKTIINNWSRALLLNFLDTDLYDREGKAISNFQKSLPLEKGELAQEITKDPYNFDFLTLRQNYDEKELKDALLDNIQSFLMELGTGFAFIGREYRLIVGETEQFIDMLFYNISMYCYVVVEVKIRDFEPADIGQIGTYISAVNGILKTERDDMTIGLLICKTKDNVLAKYAVNSSNEPIAISEYQLEKLMPPNFKNSMPTIEEIEKRLL